MNIKRLFLISVFLLLVLPLISAPLVNNPNLPIVNPPTTTTTSSSTNYSQVNVNNSQYLNGHPDTYFYPYSNPLNFINTSGGGSGNPFNQILNTTSNVTFNSVTATYIDKISQTSDPSIPPANILRLFVQKDPDSGFLVYKYLDPTGMERQLVRDSVFIVEAGEDNINAGEAVYDCGSDNNVPLVCRANANSATTMPSIGIMIKGMTATGDYGRVMMVGLLENIDTSAWNEGNILYVSNNTAGGLTNVKPSVPALSQEMGTVLVKDATLGKIQVISRSTTGNEFGTINNFYVQKNITANKYCNSTGYCQELNAWGGSSSGMNYTNLAMTNQSNVFNGTQTINGTILAGGTTNNLNITIVLIASQTFTPSYSNQGGMNSRNHLITCYTNTSYYDSSIGYTTNCRALLNGDYLSNKKFFNPSVNVLGRVIMFDFGVGSKKLITEMKWYQQSVSSQGVWRPQGSNDNSNWITIGDDFTLGSSATQTIPMTLSGVTNNAGYRYYRLLGISGNTDGAASYIYQFDFKITDWGNLANLQIYDNTTGTAGSTIKLNPFGGSTNIGGNIFDPLGNINSPNTITTNNLILNSTLMVTDTVNHRIGINFTVPQASVDINGNLIVGELQAGDSATNRYGPGVLYLGYQPDNGNSMIKMTGKNGDLWIDSMGNYDGANMYFRFYNSVALQATRLGGLGDVAIGGVTSSARLTLPAGTSVNKTAPLKFTKGTLMTVPENGSVEYDGTNFYLTNNSNIRKIIITNDTNSGISISGTNKINLNGNTSIYDDGSNTIFITNNSGGTGMAWFSNNVSATGYLTRTSVYDKSKGSALSYIKDANDYLNKDKSINHQSFYGSTSYQVIDYSKPVEEKYIEQQCDYEMENVCNTVSNCVYNQKSANKYSRDCKNVTTCQNMPKQVSKEVCDYQSTKEGDYEKVCNLVNETAPMVCKDVDKTRTTYPYTKTEQGVDLEKEIDVLRQGLFEENQMVITQNDTINKIKDCSIKSKSWEESKKCINEIK